MKLSNSVNRKTYIYLSFSISMTYEAVLVYETERPISMTCADGTGILKGTAVKMADPMTVSAAATDHDICGGITYEEKVADSGKTTVPVYRGGIFKVYVSGNVTVGDPLSIEGDTSNHFKSVVNTTALSGCKVWGYAWETATTGQTCLMELRPCHGFKS